MNTQPLDFMGGRVNRGHRPDALSAVYEAGTDALIYLHLAVRVKSDAVSGTYVQYAMYAAKQAARLGRAYLDTQG